MKKIWCFLVFILVFSIACDPTEGSGEELSVEIGVSKENPITGETISFFLKEVDVKDLQTASWDFGDQTTSSNFAVSKAYTEDGIYVVSVEVKNKAGKTASASKTISVTSSDALSLSTELRDFDTSLVWIMAHRCKSNDVNLPENSIAALMHCISLREQGMVDIVEIDPRYTKDGVMVLMHDETINRTTNGTGAVADINYDYLRTLRLKLPDGTITDDSIPTVRDFFLAAKGKMFIDLDYYEKVPTSDLYELAKECGVLDQVMFSTGNHSDAINFLLDANPKGICFTNVSSTNNINSHKQLGVLITHVSNSNVLTTSLVGTAKNAGFIVCSELLNQNGITIDNDILHSNDYSGLDAFVAAGLRVVQTDLAPKVHTYLKNQGKRK